MTKLQELFLPVDVNFGSNAKIIEVSVDAEHVYLRCSMFSKRVANDGRFKASQVRQQCDKLDRSQIESACSELVNIGLFDATDDGFEIIGFLERNKSRAALESEKAQAKANASLGNHNRWHVGDNQQPKPGCEHCFPSSIGGATPTESGGRNGGDRQDRDRDRDRDIAKTEPQPLGTIAPPISTDPATAAAAAALIEAGYRNVPPNPGEIATADRALKRGWTHEEIAACGRDIGEDARNFRAIVKSRMTDLASRVPHTTAATASTPPGEDRECPACRGSAWPLHESDADNDLGRCLPCKATGRRRWDEPAPVYADDEKPF